MAGSVQCVLPDASASRSRSSADAIHYAALSSSVHDASALGLHFHPPGLLPGQAPSTAAQPLTRAQAYTQDGTEIQSPSQSQSQSSPPPQPPQPPLCSQEHDGLCSSPPPSHPEPTHPQADTTFEWHLEGFDCAIPDALSPEALPSGHSSAICPRPLSPDLRTLISSPPTGCISTCISDCPRPSGSCSRDLEQENDNDNEKVKDTDAALLPCSHRCLAFNPDAPSDGHEVDRQAEPIERSVDPAASRPNVQHTSTEHPPSILARPGTSGRSGLASAVHPRFHEPPRPPSSARRTVSDYTGSRSESSSCTNASPRSSSPNLLRPSFRFAGIDRTSEEERDGAFSTLDPPQADHKRRALTTGSTGPTRPLIRFADAEPLDNAMPNGHVQFIAPPCPSSRPSSRLNSRPGSRSRSSVSNTTAGATINSDPRAPIRPRRRTLQFTDTPHDRIEWHERESRAPQQQSSLSQWRLASLTGEDHQLTCARSHSAASSSIAGSGGGGPRSTMSSPWARSSSRAADRTTLSSPGADADANCVFMEGLESLAALEEKQVLQERRVAAWRRRAGSVESSDMVLGLGGGGATGVRSLRRQQSDWEALIREWEQPLEDESDYQAQTESLPSPTGLSSPRPPSIESDEKELSSSLSQSSRNRAQGVLDPLDPPDSLNSPNSLDSLDPLDPEKHGYLSTAAGKTPASRTLTPPQPLSLSRIRSAGTPPPPSHGPIAAQSGPNGPLFGGASQRKRHSHRRSWNVPSENDLDRADFGRARFRRHTHTLRRTTSVPPKFLSERLGRGLRVGAEMDTETDLDQCKFSRECSPPSTLSRDAPSAGAILRPPPSPAPHTLFSSANPKTECVSPSSSCLPIHSPPKQTQETGFVRSPSPIGSPHLTGLNLEECYGHDLSPDFRPHIHHRHYSRQESPRPYFQHQFQHQAQLHYQNQHLNQRPNLHQDQPPKPILRKNATLPAPTCLIPVSGEGEGREYPCSNFTGLPLPCSPHQVRTASLPRPHFRSHPTRQATIQLSSPFLLPQALRGPEHPSLSDENGASPGSSVSFSAHESSYASNNASDNASDNASNDASDDVSADESVSESSDALPRQAVSGSYQRGNVASWSPPLRSHRIVTPATLLSAAAGQKSMDVCGPEAGGGSYSGCGAGLKSDARTSRTMTLSRSPRPSRNFSPAQLSGRNTFAKHPLEVDMGGASAAPYLNAHPGPRSRSISRSSQVFSPSTGAVSPWTGMDSPLAAPAGCMSPSVAPGVLSPGGWSNGKGSHTLLPAESGLQSPPAFARPSVATTPVQVTGQVYSHPAH